ncbi:MAG TPA: hypothetical protein VHC69_32460 [Polyangiaceae bacterium]|nr:hypothetical protein [Polyangiaceae bacterium]
MNQHPKSLTNHDQPGLPAACTSRWNTCASGNDRQITEPKVEVQIFPGAQTKLQGDFVERRIGHVNGVATGVAGNTASGITVALKFSK